MVESLDQSVGEVLAAIDRAGIADNTMVMFFSDSGGLRYEGQSEHSSPTTRHSAQAKDISTKAGSANHWLSDTREHPARHGDRYTSLKRGLLPDLLRCRRREARRRRRRQPAATPQGRQAQTSTALLALSALSNQGDEPGTSALARNDPPMLAKSDPPDHRSAARFTLPRHAACAAG